MNEARNEAPAADRDYSDLSGADQIRELLLRLGLSQRAAARELGISDRDFRGYCASQKVPRFIILALERLVDISCAIKS